MKENIIILEPRVKLEKKLKVAAYARVSTDKDTMYRSLSNQVSHYSSFIQNNQSWLYCGVYADEAITGTKDTRPEFQRMLKDARAGKIDLIITKSISRFGRNTVIILKSIRELKSIGVGVYFESERINSLSNEGELMLSIIASFAQEESRSVSQNVKWRVNKQFKQGKTWSYNLYGYTCKDGHFFIKPSEAKIVRLIYDYYLNGESLRGIRKLLNEAGLLTRRNREWNAASVRHILTNYDYTGNLILQKTYNENYITKKKIFNNGEVDKYYVENAHKSIVSIDEFNRVQKRLEEEGKKYCNKKGPLTPLAGIVFCDNCQAKCKRKTTKYQRLWLCSTYDDYGKEACAAKAVPEEEIYKALSSLGSNYKEKVDHIKIADDRVIKIYLKNGEVLTKTWEVKPRSESWTKEKRELASKKGLERRRKTNESKNNSNTTND